MSKMTFKYTASFDLTTVLDVEAAETIITEMREALADAESERPVSTKALLGMVVQAHDRCPEQGYAELIRTTVRLELNHMVRNDLLRDEKSLTLRPSPVKVVCHGIEI